MTGGGDRGGDDDEDAPPVNEGVSENGTLAFPGVEDDDDDDGMESEHKVCAAASMRHTRTRRVAQAR